MSTAANRNEATRKRVPPPDDVIAGMSKKDLRRRRRAGIDTARQQRRAIVRHRQGERLVAGLARFAEAARKASEGLGTYTGHQPAPKQAVDRFEA
jgi:hypothetical protein